VCKAEGIDVAGPGGTAGQEGNAVVAGEYEIFPFFLLLDCGEPLSKFGQMVLGRLDNIYGNQRLHHEYCAARFQLLHSEIEHVQD